MNKSLNQNGIALIQVLLITAVLSTLAIYLTNTAKDQVAMARWANDKSQALVELNSAESELMFVLLTQAKTGVIETKNGYSETAMISRRWNFFGHPFTLTQRVVATIQDQAGLINAHYPDSDLLKKFISANGFTADEAENIIDNLLDWQDLDKLPRLKGAEYTEYNGVIRDGAVPDTHDFSFVKQITPALAKLLVKNTTIYRRGPFNPTTAPPDLLYSIVGVNVGNQVLQLRNNGQLTKRNFSQLTGLTEDDDSFFYPSNYLEIDLESKVGESIVQKKISLHIDPYAKALNRPINIFSVRS